MKDLPAICATFMFLPGLMASSAFPAPLAVSQPAPIPLDQIGRVAGTQNKAEGLAVIGCGDSARLECAYQRLEGDASREGLWIRSTTEAQDQRPGIRIIASSLGREGRLPQVLPAVGTVRVDDQHVRFIRPVLTEEYSVSVDGIRQDFLIAERPPGTGELCLELALQGARAEPAAGGARLGLDGSGRTLAYSRLRATDSRGRELAARMTLEGMFDGGVGHDTRDAYSSQLVVVVDDTDAVYPIRIDPTFSDADWVSLNSLPGADEFVYAMTADSSGNLYVGGLFTAIGTVVANSVAKWDGNEWSALGSGIQVAGPNFAAVSALAVIGTDLYVGGKSSVPGGMAVNHIAKWNGSAWSALGSGVQGGVDPRVYDLAVIGTNLYAGGLFTAAGEVAASNVAKWNGSEWSALGSGLSGVGAYDAVDALAVIGTDLYAGGGFTSAGGIPAKHIAKWDGNAWSQVGSGLSEGVSALAVSGSLLYAAGGTVTRWNGSNWSALGSGMGGSFPTVRALEVMGTDLYAGGRFTTAGGVTANHMARWNGSQWSALGVGVSGDVHTLAVIGSDLYVGGGFVTAGGVAASHIAKWNGGSWSAVSAGMSAGYSGVSALAVSETHLYIGGDFTTAPGGVPAKNIAKWDGSTWSALGPGVDGRVRALAMSGTELYAGGDFATAGGVTANHIAKWNGSSWSALGSGVSGGGDWTMVAALASSGTDLYAGGYFTTAGGIPANSIAKWNGSSWSALGSGLYGGGTWTMVAALASSGAELYAGGGFTTAGGIPVNRIAKWNGSTWSALGSGVGGGVEALTAMGTDLYAGGVFTTAGGVEANGIAKWDGSAWSALDSGTSSEPEWQQVYALAASGNDLYAGGWGYLNEGEGYPLVAKWDGSQWSGIEPGLNGGINALAADDSGHLFVGGGFVSAGNTVSPNIIQANITGLDFTWDLIASPQEVDVSIPVMLTARNAAGEVRADFTNGVSLSGYAPGPIATNLTLGTGTSSWGYPLHARYHDARTQVIYPASELGRACTISSLALEVTATPGQALENWTIRLKHTTLAKFPESPSWEVDGWAGWLYTDEPPGAPGWRTFELSAPFEYNGTDNVLIDFSFDNDSYSSEGQCRATNAGAYRSITFATDGAYGDPLNWSGTTPLPVRSQVVPNVVLGASFPGTFSIPVSPETAGPFVDGVWTGEVTVLEPVAGVILRADDGLGHEGESNPFDVESVVAPDTDGDGLADAWELSWFPSLTNVAYQTDWDGDGFWDGFECAAGTSPVDPGSYLGITSVEVNAAGTEAAIRWSSVGGKLYTVYGITNLVGGATSLLDEHILATPPVNIYTDTVEGVDTRSYGVEVEH